MAKKPEQAAGPEMPTPMAPVADGSMTFKEIGSGGLRQFSGYVREEFLPVLQGRQAARLYREMMDNNAAIGGSLLAITGAMRKVPWRTDPADDSAKAQEMADFAESLRNDMSGTWEDFIAEALSMLGYGFAPHEIVYKKRQGRKPRSDAPKSDYDDGKIGIRKLALRGQDTVLKWFFGSNGEILGVQQQPYTGPLIDIPIEKMLLFRPAQHKNNPEGRSILRTAYRDYYFIKRMEEGEAILLERMSGFPVLKLPSSVMEGAASGDPKAQAALAAYKKIVTNVRIDEQMGALLPSDHYMQGGTAGSPMYEFELLTPQGGRQSLNADTPITRHNLGIATAMLTDFMIMGHDARGAQNLGETKLDMFMQAVEGWLNSLSAVLNRHLLPRVWDLNGEDYDLMPTWVPDTAQRLDLDVMSNFLVRMSQAGMPLFPDEELESYIRDAAGLPDISEDSGAALVAEASTQAQIAGHDATADDPQGIDAAAAMAETNAKFGQKPGSKPGAKQGKTKPVDKDSPIGKMHRIIKASTARRARKMGWVS